MPKPQFSDVFELQKMLSKNIYHNFLLSNYKLLGTMVVCHTEFLQNKAEVEVENIIVTVGVKSLQWYCNLLRILTHCCCDVSAGHPFSLQGQQEASFN